MAETGGRNERRARRANPVRGVCYKVKTKSPVSIVFDLAGKQTSIIKVTPNGHHSLDQ